MGHRGNIVVVIEGAVERGRRFEQMAHDLLFLGAVHPAFHHRELRGERGEHRELAGERLGRGDADLGPRVDRQQQVRLARHRAGRHVDDRRDGLPLRLAIAQRGERVGGLAALRDKQREPALGQRRFAVTELARHIDIDRHARELFDPVLADHAGVIGGAARDDGHALDAGEIEIHLRQRYGLVRLADIAGERLRDHGRLFEDLLLHEVAVIAPLHGSGAGARGDDLAFDLMAVDIENLRALARYDRPVAFFEVGNALRQRREPTNISPSP